MDEIDFDDSAMPTSDIDAHLRHLRRMTVSTDPKVLADSTPESKAVAPSFVALAHAFANCVDSYRAHGYSAGTVVAIIQAQLIEPINDLPIIDSSSS